MKRICAWCNTDLGARAAPTDSEITHGICRPCADELIVQMGTPLRRFLDGLDVPILVVDESGTTQAANARACRVLGKELSEIEGHREGTVLDCVNAALPGGCGKTDHCKACMIRRTVLDTFITGQGRSRVSADVQTPSGPLRGRFQISTEKVQDVVLLRFDDIEDH